ncbi:hypothetical protein K432DRAFT_346763 [Lepidopterella palustris CBS 459.81]|uniref:Transferase family protein n=1 Tax=Lepidopterella palustris CBS 459.81 TaxID=1314670 RepID=A0A8E2EGG9_9PEZI|nr:hypothetical protein K432DRAFT_346763 [Lepidopterella palustris CBS 459.81]
MASSTVCTLLTPFDLIPPKVYIKFVIYLPLQPSRSAEEVYANLQQGLIRTFQQISLLSGKVHLRPPSSPGWRPGQLEVRHDKVWNPPADLSGIPRQLKKKDISAELDCTYEELKDDGFPFSAFEDELVITAPFVPDVAAGVDVFTAQANFLEGGCLLAGAIHHSVADGTGMMLLMQAWAAHCKAAASSLTSKEIPQLAARLHSGTLDRSVLDKAWSQIPERQHTSEVESKTWHVLGLDPPVEHKYAATQVIDRVTKRLVKKTMQSSIFYMSGTQFAQLKKDTASRDKSLATISANDALLALFWRCLMKARVNAKHAASPSENEEALLQSPVDGRAAFSSNVPRLYLGNVVLVNQIYMPVAALVRPTTTLHDVASCVRESALKINHDSVHDAYTLAREVQDYTALKHAFTSLEGFAMMITSLVALPFEDFDFGDRLFGNQGKPDNLRPLMGGFNRAFRLCVVLPQKAHGGLELLVSLFEDEMGELISDKEFSRYATFLCY